jgi:hypothetical protein
MLTVYSDARAQAITIGTWAGDQTYTYFIYIPPNPRPGNPWVLVGPATGPTGGDWNSLVVADFVSRGIYVASIWLPGYNGSPEGYGIHYAQIDPWVTYMISTYSLAAKPSIWMQSRSAIEWGMWAVMHPTRVQAISGEYPIAGGVYEYPGITNPALLSAWNMTQAQVNAFAPTVTPNNYASNLVGIPVRIWQGTADVTAQPPLTALFLAEVGSTASEVLVQGMGHVTYYNKGMVDFLDQYLPTQPIAAISCPYRQVITSIGTIGTYQVGAQTATNANGAGSLYDPQSFNQTITSRERCLGQDLP